MPLSSETAILCLYLPACKTCLPATCLPAMPPRMRRWRWAGFWKKKA